MLAVAQAAQLLAALAKVSVVQAVAQVVQSLAALAKVSVVQAVAQAAQSLAALAKAFAVLVGATDVPQQVRMKLFAVSQEHAKVRTQYLSLTL